MICTECVPLCIPTALSLPHPNHEALSLETIIETSVGGQFLSISHFQGHMQVSQQATACLSPFN